ncbi:hypothetical protein OG718_53780 [Streptomyces sp. NBC_00258]|nr:hypothetical protein [Streptomyces sp. NBC_00258]
MASIASRMPGDVVGVAVVHVRRPARRDDIRHHHDLLLGQVDDDVAVLVVRARVDQLEALAAHGEAVVLTGEGDVRHGALGIGVDPQDLGGHLVGDERGVGELDGAGDVVVVVVCEDHVGHRLVCDPLDARGRNLATASSMTTPVRVTKK